MKRLSEEYAHAIQAQAVQISTHHRVRTSLVKHADIGDWVSYCSRARESRGGEGEALKLSRHCSATHGEAMRLFVCHKIHSLVHSVRRVVGQIVMCIVADFGRFKRMLRF